MTEAWDTKSGKAAMIFGGVLTLSPIAVAGAVVPLSHRTSCGSSGAEEDRSPIDEDGGGTWSHARPSGGAEPPMWAAARDLRPVRASVATARRRSSVFGWLDPPDARGESKGGIRQTLSSATMNGDAFHDPADHGQGD